MQGYHYPCFNVTSPIPDVCLVLVQSDRKLNTFTEAMRRDFRRLITRLSDDSQVRAIVIAGAGDHFTAGLDLQEAMKGPILSGVDRTIDPARKARINREYILDFQACVDVVERCVKPVITALHGLSYGLAIDLACCADMRICAANTRFCVKEIDIGIAADLGTLSRLPRMVGNASFVRDVCLTGREFSAQEAAQVGFVSYVEETRERAIDQAVEIAGQIAQKSPVAIQGTKDILNHARDHPVGESLRYTAVWNGAALQTQDVKEAMLSFRLRKMPTFEKL